MDAIENVKKQCSNVTFGLIEELERRFPTQDIMNATGIIYSQLWVQPQAKHTFLAQLNILKAHYCHGKNVNLNQVFINPILNELLDR